MKLKIFLSILYPPVTLGISLMVAFIIGDIVYPPSSFDREPFRDPLLASIWHSSLIFGQFFSGFIVIVLFPIFYFVLWSSGDVNKHKIKTWFLTSCIAVVIYLIGLGVLSLSFFVISKFIFDGDFRIYFTLGMGVVLIFTLFFSIYFSKNQLRTDIIKTTDEKLDYAEGIELPTNTTKEKVVKRLMIVLSIVSFLNAFSLAVLQAWWMSGLSFLLVIIMLNFTRTSSLIIFKKFALAVTLISMIVATPITLNQLTHGIRHIGDVATISGPQSLSYPTRFGLWWSAIWLSIGGIAYLTPYTVAEQVLMFWPGEKERLWNSDFPTKAKKVRAFVKQAKKEAKNRDASYKYDLLWKSYCQDNCDVGLALNGGDLTVDISNNGQGCIATARVSVSYKPQYRGSTILGYGKYRLRIDQASYWSLQELGWLFPYTLRYQWNC